jgi:putative hydrolase of the HAD superfamily
VLRRSQPETPVTLEQIRPYLQSGFPWHAPENPHPGLSADEWWEELFPIFLRAFRSLGQDPTRARELARGVRPVYTDPAGWQTFPDALPALERLSTLGWTHLLLSNHVPELADLLVHLGLADRFAVVFNSAETGYEKPNVKAFQLALQWAGPAAPAWVIGDRYSSDIVGAREAGLPAVLVRGFHPDAPLFCKALAGIEAIVRG